MDRHSRRDFLKASAFTAGAAMLGAGLALAVDPPHMEFPTAPPERLAAGSSGVVLVPICAILRAGVRFGR